MTNNLKWHTKTVHICYYQWNNCNNDTRNRNQYLRTGNTHSDSGRSSSSSCSPISSSRRGVGSRGGGGVADWDCEEVDGGGCSNSENWYKYQFQPSPSRYCHEQRGILLKLKISKGWVCVGVCICYAGMWRCGCMCVGVNKCIK